MKLTESRIKKIIKEEMDLLEMDIDPMTLVLGAGAVIALYKMFFGGEPTDHEAALQAVRDHVAKLEAQVNVGDDMFRGPSAPPGQGDMQAIKRKARLKRLRQQYGKTKDI